MSECVGRECCPYGLDEKFLDKIKESAYEQGKADGRAEEREKHFRKIMSFINTNNRGNCDYFIVDQIENYIAEQLKEKNK